MGKKTSTKTSANATPTRQSSEVQKAPEKSDSSNEISSFLIVLYCLAYAFISGQQSVVAKKIYATFPEFKSPNLVISTQFIFNLLSLGILATIKHYKRDWFGSSRMSASRSLPFLICSAISFG